jgi:hypothetical protein
LTELQEKLNAALLKLSEPHRLVVVLHDVQGTIARRNCEDNGLQHWHGAVAAVLRPAAITGVVVRLFEVKI